LSYFDDNEERFTWSGKKNRAAHYHNKRRETVECDRCGEDELRWLSTANGWRLIDAEGDKHVCPPKVTADDFEVLE
jgi:hypothetical protein